MVGKCMRHERINSCTGGMNLYTADTLKVPQCKKGHEYGGGVKITISCEGHTKGTEKTSCSGKTEKK